MFFCSYLGLVGCLFVSLSYCQDGNLVSAESDQSDDLVLVKLSVDTEQQSPPAVKPNELSANQISDPFACHVCTNCTLKSESIIRSCNAGINMCYKIHKRTDNKRQIIQRGCSASKGQCTVPDGDQSNLFDSITCCTSSKCNQGIQLNPLFCLPIIGFFINILIIQKYSK